MRRSLAIAAVIAATALALLLLHQRSGQVAEAWTEGRPKSIAAPSLSATTTTDLKARSIPGPLPTRQTTTAGILAEREQERSATPIGVGGEITGALIENGRIPAASFTAALRQAVMTDDRLALLELIEDAALCKDCQEPLDVLMTDTSNTIELRAHAAAALMRLGSSEAAEAVINHILISYDSGQHDTAEQLLPALKECADIETAHSLFSVLLSDERYAEQQTPLPDPMVTVLQDTLRHAWPRQEIGALATDLYLRIDDDAEERRRQLDDLAHPGMLAALAVSMYRAEDVASGDRFMDRLGETAGQGVIEAVMQLSEGELVSEDDAATLLYLWTMEHPESAHPGLYSAYVTDADTPPSLRIVAALGAAACSDTNAATHLLEKALLMEKDERVASAIRDAMGLVGDHLPKDTDDESN